jgi:hypothetical protein
MEMRPQKQTILHSEKENGNCLQACIASLLDMPIDDVPHFADHRGSDWFDKMNEWLIKQGYWVLVISGWDNEFTPHGYCIANGISPRGVMHSVIAKDGKVYFDPHPSDDGISEIDSYWLLVKVL